MLLTRCASVSERHEIVTFSLPNGYKRSKILTGFLFACYLRARLTVRVRVGKRESKADSNPPPGRQPRLEQVSIVLIFLISGREVENTKTRAFCGYTRTRTLGVITALIVSQCVFGQSKRKGTDHNPDCTWVRVDSCFHIKFSGSMVSG